MPFPPFAAIAAATPLAAACAAGRGHCPRLQAARPLAAMPLPPQAVLYRRAAAPVGGFRPREQRRQASRVAALRRQAPLSFGGRRRCPAAPLLVGCQPRQQQACCKQTAGWLLQAQRLRMRRRCAAWLRLRLPL